MVAVILIASGLLLVVLGELGRRRLLRQNAVAGLRTPLTMSDRAAWEHVHWKAAPWVISSGLSPAAAGVAILVAGTAGVLPWATLGSAVISVTLLAIGTLRAQRDYRRQQDSR
ncbi:SdpI family protein [Nonomuraea maritima]|uniref:SdpI family protein n=1 Tax=Nonomuraea maritima TaxID=683260 RepID=UPI0037130178